MRIIPEGQEHSVGDLNCPSCDTIHEERYPRPHKDAIFKHCSGLLHAEYFGELSTGTEIHYRCDKCDHFE
jgi:hypothetical protein